MNKKLLDESFLSFTEDELWEMANISDKGTGIKDVVIWVGAPPESYEHRIKVCNIPNQLKSNNCFILTISDFRIIGEVDTSFIDEEKLNKIIEFIKINMDTIILYSEYQTSTDVFLNNLIKV